MEPGKTALSTFYSYEDADAYKKCLENDYKDYIHTKTYMYAPIDLDPTNYLSVEQVEQVEHRF